MVAGPEVMSQVVPMLESSFHRCPVKGTDEVVVVAAVSSPPPPPVASPKADSLVDLEVPDLEFKTSLESFIPTIRSGSFADIGPRRYMEDEHIRIDDLSGHLGSLLVCPAPNAFYGVFDGHGGSDAAAYMKRHAMRLFFEDSEFPNEIQEDETFSESVENSIRKAFLSADLALADDSVISRSSGTTALTALIFARWRWMVILLLCVLAVATVVGRQPVELGVTVGVGVPTVILFPLLLRPRLWAFSLLQQGMILVLFFVAA